MEQPCVNGCATDMHPVSLGTIPTDESYVAGGRASGQTCSHAPVKGIL